MVYSTKQQQAQPQAQPQVQPQAQAEYQLRDGEVVLEVRMGLGRPGKNSRSSLATLRGSDPVGGIYRNSTSGTVFMKVGPTAFLYEKGQLAWGDDGLPKTGLVNATLRVKQSRPLSPQAQEVLTYLRSASIVPIDPASPQADQVLAGNQAALAALKELRSSGEIRKEIMTREAWANFQYRFFGGDFPDFFCNPSNGEDLARELEELGDREALKDYSLVVGLRLRQGDQPCWTERDEATVGTRKGSAIKPIVIPGTDQVLKRRPVNADLAYLRVEEGKNRVIDPSRSMNKSVFQGELNAFLSEEDTSSEGYGLEELTRRRDKWADLRETLRGEASGKKKVKVRKAAIREMAKDPSRKAELQATIEEVSKIVDEGVSPHWTPGVLENLRKDVEELSSSTLDLEEEDDEGPQGVKALSSEDLPEPAPAPETVTRATGSAASILERLSNR